MPTLSSGNGGNTVPKIQVKSATNNGFEEASEGDSINFSMPNSKTRRGRVGVGVAQTLDTQANQSVVVKNNLVTDSDILCIFENKIKNYGKEIERNTIEILFALWKEIGTQSFTEWGFGVSDTFQQEGVLQPCLYVTSVRCKTCKDRYITIECQIPCKEDNSEGEVRIMWQAKCEGCSPQRREHIQQCEGEFNENLPGLSHQITPQESFLQGLRKTTILFGVLQQTLFEIQEIWKRLNVKGENMLTDSPTLHGFEHGTNGQFDRQLLNGGMIRRLTERECEMLQGFPKNWTEFGIYDKQVWINKKENTFEIVQEKHKIPKTQRYKLCGNAVTVDVVEMIGAKLVDEQEIVLISLFSGIDGFAEGLTRAGFKISHHYFSEIDKHAIANAKYNFPNAEHIGSVTNVSGISIRAKHPTAKIIVTFGWPCQDNSIAGKRKGQRAGTRSGLLSEAGRIISECRPQNFIAENVKGLLSVNEGIDFYEAVRFLSYLDTGSPQYTVEMQLLNTAWLLPQNRERTYFVGHIGTGSVKRVFPITENDFGATERTGNATSVRTITGGGHSGGMHSSMTLLRV